MRKKRISAKDSTRILSKVRKSPMDIREYRAIQLANGMVVLLVHDPLVPTAEGEAEPKTQGGRKRMSAAAMSVGVGNLHAPKEVQGIAHMLEHMLTMGSELFPGEEDYEVYIKEHGGEHSEETDAGSACYSFEVNGEHLEGALKRFSQCFTAPLLRESTLEREIIALDEEFHQDKDDVVNLLERLRCHTSEANHLYNKVLPGNKESLIHEMDNYTRLQKQISAFHHKHYRARNLKLVLIGGEPINVLENWVKELFGAIRKGPVRKTFISKRVCLRSQKRNLPNKAKKLPKLYPEQKSMKPIWKPGQVYRVESKTSGHVLEVVWTFPCLHKLYQKKPEEYMSHYLGYEGRGSLFSLLKARGWATSLNAGVLDEGIYRTSVSYIFLLSIHLTDTGLKEVPNIIRFVYQYLKVLRDSRPKWMFKEVKWIGKLEFHFGDEPSQRKYAAKLSENLLFSSPKHVIGADYVVNEWDEHLIRKFLHYFVPANMRVDIVSESFELEDSESEPWSGICYSVEDLKDFMKQSTATSEDNASLQFPSKNRFITKNFILCAEDTCDVPTCIVDEQRMKFWYKKDNTFKVPRADIYLRINLKEACFDVRSSALTEYFIHLLKDELSEVISEAKIAMLEILISFVDGMLELKVSGFNEKLPLLLREVLSKVSSFMRTEERFQLMKNDMKESLMNQDTVFLKTILCEHNYENHEKLSYLDDDLSHDTFKKFIEVLRSEAYIEGLCHGNMTEKDANDTCIMIRETFPGNPLPDMSRHVERVVCLPCNADLVMDFNASNLDEKLSVAEVYLQFEQDLELASSKWMALFDLFCDIVEGPFFDQLRNQEQRGYDVKCYPLILQSVFGFCFHVKSYRYNPDTLQDRIGNFIETGFFQRFSDISFNNHKTSLVEKLMQKASSLKGESGRLWAEIVEQRSKFDIDIKKAEELKKINKKEMKNWCRKYLKISSRHCKRLTIKCWSATTDMEVDDSESDFTTVMEVDDSESDFDTYMEVDDSKSDFDRIEEFKKTHGFYPYRVDD